MLSSQQVFCCLLLSISLIPTLSAQTYVYNEAGLATGNVPAAVVIADFNADGRPDLAIVNEGDNTVSLLLSKPDGSFASKVDYNVGKSPFGLATADFNGDHIPDLAVVNSQDNTISILLGNGDGTFQPQVTYATGITPDAIVAVDLNGDHKIDLAVTNLADGTISTFLGKGDGTFLSGSPIPTIANPVTLVGGDFNNDGLADLIASNSNGALSFLLSNTNGTYSTPLTSGLGYAGPGSLAVGDFNGDGNLDLAAAVANGARGDVVVFLGDGKGGLHLVDTPQTIDPETLVVGDFNGDGKLDLVVAGVIPGSSAIAVLPGNGDGSFQLPPQPINGGGNGGLPLLAAADFNNDGAQDIVALSPSYNMATVQLNNGKGILGSYVTSSVEYPATFLGPYREVAADFNHDGKTDLAAVHFVQNGAAGSLSVIPGNGDGTFQAGIVTQVAEIGYDTTVAGDFNGDGILDIAMSGTYSPSGLTILLGKSDGTFTEIDNGIPPGSSGSGLTPLDFNHDGKTDLAVFNNSGPNSVISVLLSNGDGTFSRTVVGGANINNLIAQNLTFGDFNHDGYPDFVLGFLEAGIGPNIAIYLSKADGTYLPPVTYKAGDTSNLSVTTADFNGDGNIDLVAGTDYGFFFFAGNGDGTFRAPVETLTGQQIGPIAAGDFNGDGKMDIEITDTAYGNEVALGNGDGTFQQPIFFNPSSVAGDFNGDGIPDLAGSVTINSVGSFGQQLVNNYDTVFLSTPTIALSTTHYSFLSQDIGTSSPPAPLTVSNPGSAPLSLTHVAISGNFTLANNCPNTLPVGQHCYLDVTFSPTAVGSNIGTLTLTDNSLAGTQVIALSGTSTAPVTLAPTTLTFAAQVEGIPSATQTVTLTNSGHSALGVTSVSTSGDFAQTNTCGTSLSVGAYCYIYVTFTPTAAGSRTGTLTITDSAAGSPQAVALTGTGPTIQVTAASNSLAISSPGSGATDMIQVFSMQGFTGMVNLSCAVTYQGSGASTDLPLCTLTPQQGQLLSSSPVVATLALSTTAVSASTRGTFWPVSREALAVLLCLGLLPRRRNRLPSLLALLVITALCAATGCGGGTSGAPSNSNPGTTAGNYQIVVTATSSPVTASTTISLTLQ